MNGIYRNNLLVRKYNDTHVSDIDVVITLKTENLSELWSIYDDNMTEYNIILDHRLTPYIIYAFMKYKEDILIMDVSSANGNIINIFEYFRLFMSPDMALLSLKNSVIVMQLYMLYEVYFPTACRTWNISECIQNIYRNSKFSQNIIKYAEYFLSITQYENQIITADEKDKISEFIKSAFTKTAFESDTLLVINHMKIPVTGYKLGITLREMQINSFEFYSPYK